MDIQDEAEAEAVARALMEDPLKMGYDRRWTDREIMAVQRYLHHRMDEMEGPLPIKHTARWLEFMEAFYTYYPAVISAPPVSRDLELASRALQEEARLNERRTRSLIYRVAREAKWLEVPPVTDWPVDRGWLMAKVGEERFCYDGNTWTREGLADGFDFNLWMLNESDVLDGPLIEGTGLLGKACQGLTRLCKNWEVVELYDCDATAAAALKAGGEEGLSEEDDETVRTEECDDAVVRRVLETEMDEACVWTPGELRAVGRCLKRKLRRVSAVLPIWHTGRKLWDAENQRQWNPELSVVLTKKESKLIGRAMIEESHWMFRFVKELDAPPADDAAACWGWAKAVIEGVDFCFDGKGWTREVPDDEDEEGPVS